MNLLLAIPVQQSDLPLVAQLLRVLKHFGPYPNSVLFVLDKSLHAAQVETLLAPAKELFALGSCCQPSLALPDTSFPRGYNLLFETCAVHVARVIQTPYLWLDPRCVPLRKDWLTSIECEYMVARRQKKDFMGHVLTPAANGTAQSLLALPAIYPVTLPKAMTARLMTRRQELWEKSCADIVTPLAHPTALIHCVPRDVTVPEALPPAAVLVHCAQPKALVDRVLGTNAAPPTTNLAPVSSSLVVTPPAPAVTETVTPVTPPAAPAANASYYHSGDLGDIIYALAAIKLAGGGKLLLGPRQRHTPSAADPIKLPKFELLAPLLAQQPYLTRVAFTDRHPGTDGAIDLNHYRDTLTDPRFAPCNIVQAHCRLLRVLEQHHPSQTWLTVSDPIRTGMFAISATPRYRDPSFPWPMVLKHFADLLLFVGLPQEHAAFEREQDVKCAFYRCLNFLDLARVIAGARGFLGNQSFPLALAQGLGVRCLIEHWPERDDSRLIRPTTITQPLTEDAVKAWRNSA